MIKNYSNRLDKLKERRFDPLKKASIFSKSFENTEYGQALRYCFESMGEIEPEYTQNTIKAAEKVKGYLQSELPVPVEFRYQGSVMTNTHIKLHSDIDLLVIHTWFYTLEVPQVPTVPYNGNPENELKGLRENCIRILTPKYEKVDADSTPKAVEVYQTIPKRKIDVVTCNWYNSNEYANHEFKTEILRGVNIYDSKSHTRGIDYPFYHIYRVTSKDTNVQGCYRKIVRLLKTLKVDADNDIDLSSFEIASLIYAISDNLLTKSPNHQLLLLSEASNQLSRLINNKYYRENLISPNGKELVFGQNESKVGALGKLKKELDELILDLREELEVKTENLEKSLTY
jgi:hypothetical protein